MENQLGQWMPVVVILIAIIGVGVNLRRNADKAHETIGKNISRIDDKLGGKVDGLTEKFNNLQVEVKVNSAHLEWIKNKLGGPTS